MRADSGFYTHAIVAACRRMDVRFSITIRQSASLRSLIEAIPEDAWTPIPYWMEGAADVAETSYTPFQSGPDAAPVRLIVRRVKPTPGSQLALFATRVPKTAMPSSPDTKHTRTPPIARPPPMLPDHASLKSRDGNPPSKRHQEPPTAEGIQPKQQLPPTNNARPATPRQLLEETPPRPPRRIR